MAPGWTHGSSLCLWAGSCLGRIASMDGGQAFFCIGTMGDGMTQQQMVAWLRQWVAQHQQVPIEQVDMDADLFAQGYVDSLGIWRMVFELSQQLNRPLDMDALLQGEDALSICELAKRIEAAL
ncbi:MAG TPA: acyl carrier protein [Sulfurivirga caldicuralii]|nr:acyl carrier protein [Sulfurivirga caldicuralii]